MVKLSEYQKHDLNRVGDIVVAFMKNHPYEKYAYYRQLCELVADDYDLQTMTWSKSYIYKLKKRAGINKTRNRLVKLHERIVKWLQLREHVGIATTAQDVKLKWKVLSINERIPSTSTLWRFREKNHIWIDFNTITGAEDVWNLPITGR